MLLAFYIEGDEAGGPLDVEVSGQGLGIPRYSEGDQVLFDEPDDLLLGIRDRIHLLAADSAGVEKIEQYGFAFRACPL